MNPKLKQELEITERAVQCCKTGLANLLTTEAARYKAKADALIVADYHKGATNDADKRLIRDHEIRSETFKTAATLIAG
jgi:hypothetical protein